MRLVLPALLALAVTTPAVAQDADRGTQVYRKILRSTVWIISPMGGGRAATGSGSLVDRGRRLVLTNFHVVGDRKDCRVFFPMFRGDALIAEKSYYREHLNRGIRGEVKALDKRADLALIQLAELPTDAPALKLAPESAAPGQTVHSIGSPGSSDALWVYTPGRVRQVYHKKWRAGDNRETHEFDAQVVETDSATNPGDSGGPLVNDKGELVGVTEGYSPSARLLSTFIDVSEVRKLLDRPEVQRLPTQSGSVASAPPRKHEQPFAVRDQAKFFGPEAVKQADAQIAELFKQTGRDLLIETVPGPPAEQAERVKAMGKPERDKFFDDWAEERLRHEGVNGVYVLIVRDPPVLRVRVSQSARAAGFTEAALKELVGALIPSLREKKYDEGLAAAVKLVKAKLVPEK